MGKMLKRTNGITLVALVVTIVILIILATISINAVLGENGLIKRAEKAAEYQANAEAKDNESMSELDKYLSNVIERTEANGGGTGEGQLQISYEIEDIDASGKAVILKKGLSAEKLENAIQSIIGVTITDDMRTEMQESLESKGITYEEAILELAIEISADMTITAQTREGMQAIAEGYDITYEEYLLEQIIGAVNKVPITDAERTDTKEFGKSINMTYLQLMGENLKANTTIDILEDIEYIEVTIGNTIVPIMNSGFIATRNGEYTVKIDHGRQAKIKVMGIVEEKFSEIYEETTTYTEGELTAKIPAGFAVGISEGINTIAGGLVITDAVDENGYSIGNEYVWIPVGEDEGDFKRESFKSTTLDSDYTEPLNYTVGTTTYTGYATEEAEYNTMKTQVLEHHGFYIARYEAGVNSTTFRTEETDAQEVVSKRGVAPYNCVKWGDATDNIGTNGAVYLSKNMYTGKIQTNSVTSTLCYGVQWDAMCRYIGDYERIADEKAIRDVTGRVGEDNFKNIYDLAGNCREWTMEASGTEGRVMRGGAYDYFHSISDREAYLTKRNFADDCFRVTLYVK